MNVLRFSTCDLRSSESDRKEFFISLKLEHYEHIYSMWGSYLLNNFRIQKGLITNEQYDTIQSVLLEIQDSEEISSEMVHYLVEYTKDFLIVKGIDSGKFESIISELEYVYPQQLFAPIFGEHKKNVNINSRELTQKEEKLLKDSLESFSIKMGNRKILP